MAHPERVSRKPLPSEDESIEDRLVRAADKRADAILKGEAPSDDDLEIARRQNRQREDERIHEALDEDQYSDAHVRRQENEDARAERRNRHRLDGKTSFLDERGDIESESLGDSSELGDSGRIRRYQQAEMDRAMAQGTSGPIKIGDSQPVSLKPYTEKDRNRSRAVEQGNEGKSQEKYQMYAEALEVEWKDVRTIVEDINNDQEAQRYLDSLLEAKGWRYAPPEGEEVTYNIIQRLKSQGIQDLWTLPLIEGPGTGILRVYRRIETAQEKTQAA